MNSLRWLIDRLAFWRWDLKFSRGGNVPIRGPDGRMYTHYAVYRNKVTGEEITVWEK